MLRIDLKSRPKFVGTKFERYKILVDAYKSLQQNHCPQLTIGFLLKTAIEQRWADAVALFRCSRDKSRLSLLSSYGLDCGLRSDESLAVPLAIPSDRSCRVLGLPLKQSFLTPPSAHPLAARNQHFGLVAWVESRLPFGGDLVLVAWRCKPVLLSPSERAYAKELADFVGYALGHEEAKKDAEYLRPKAAVLPSPGSLMQEAGSQYAATTPLATPLTTTLAAEADPISTWPMASSEMFWRWDLASNIIWVDEATIGLFGYDKARHGDLRGWWLEHIHDDDREKTERTLQEALEGGSTVSTVSYRFLYADGSYAPLFERVLIKRDSSGRAIEMIGVTTDLTVMSRQEAERQKLIKQLAAERNVFRTVLDQMPAGLLVIDAVTGIPLLTNKTLEARPAQPLRRHGSTTANYRRWRGRRPLGEELEAADWPFARSIAAGEMVDGQEIQIDRGAGSWQTELVSSVPIWDSQGKIVAAAAIFFDITQLRQTEAALYDAKVAAEDANKSKSAFLANMSHEIRTPLGIIQGFTDLILNQPTSPEEGAVFLKTISRNCDHLLRIIDDILDLSKVEAGRETIDLTYFCLADLLSDLNLSLGGKAHEKGLRYCVTSSTPLPDRIYSDQTRLRQILVNIIGNAIKFTEHGSVLVDVSLHWSGRSEDPGQLRFSVRDEGIGMLPERQAYLFQPFMQADHSTKRRFGGTGLGLFLSRKLAHLLGGELQLQDSAPNAGSTFLITIDPGPLNHTTFTQLFAPVEQPKAERRTATQQIDLCGKMILLAEDSLDNQELIRRVLEQAGAHVEVAGNGRDAVEKAERGHHHLVLMDMQMPIMDGFEATAILRQRGYRKPVIALTAHAMSDVRHECLKAGCNDQLTKPIERDLFIRTIADYSSKAPSLDFC